MGLTLAFVLLGEIAATANANTKLDPSIGADLIRESKIRMLETSEWWDGLWSDTLGNNSTSTVNNKALSSVLFPFLLVVGLVLMAKAGISYLSGESHRIVTQQLVPIVLLIAFTTNYGWGAKAISWSFREIANKGGDVLLDATWAGVVVRDALEDNIHSVSVLHAIDRRSQRCAQLPAPNIKAPPVGSEAAESQTPQQSRTQTSSACLKGLALFIEREEAKIKAECPKCKTSQDVIASKKQDVLSQINRVNQSLIDTINPIDDIVDGFNAAKEASARGASIKLPLQVQYWFVSGQELALLLSAMLAPIMIIYASLPISGHSFAGLMYLKALVIIALVRFAYIFVIGFGAVFLSDNPVVDQGYAFATFLGYVAPLVAVAAVTGGALAASGAYTGAVVATVGAVVSTVSSAGLAVSSAAQSRALRNR